MSEDAQVLAATAKWAGEMQRQRDEAIAAIQRVRELCRYADDIDPEDRWDRGYYCAQREVLAVFVAAARGEGNHE